MNPPDDPMEMAALYALDALGTDERAQFEVIEAGDRVLRDEVDGFRAVAAVLAEAVETAPSTPSPGVWQRISAEIAGTAGTEKRPALATVTDIRDHKRWTRIAIFVSAAAVIASVALGIRVLDLQNQLAEGSVAGLAGEALTADGSHLVALQGQDGFEDASANIVIDADGTGYMVTDSLAALPADRTYQLWAIVAGEDDEVRVVSAGVLGRNPGVSQFTAAGAVTGFVITEEVAGGVPVAEGPAVVVGSLDA
jgi:anti-sigma-K factor RskA